jgi:hypothetical protein
VQQFDVNAHKSWTRTILRLPALPGRDALGNGRTGLARRGRLLASLMSIRAMQCKEVQNRAKRRLTRPAFLDFLHSTCNWGQKVGNRSVWHAKCVLGESGSCVRIRDAGVRVIRLENRRGSDTTMGSTIWLCRVGWRGPGREQFHSLPQN